MASEALAARIFAEKTPAARELLKLRRGVCWFLGTRACGANVPAGRTQGLPYRFLPFLELGSARLHDE
jgi:hypothetical protein